MNDDEFLNDRDCTPKGETPRVDDNLIPFRGYGEMVKADFARELERELIEARADLEREIMRLAACGVVALANTPESAKRAREMQDEYRSDSLHAVQSAVDREMHYRAELARALRVVEAAKALWLAANVSVRVADECWIALDKAIEEWEAGQ